MRPTLYHMTCSHGRKGIGLRGRIVPQSVTKPPWLPIPLVWMTSSLDVTAEELGLTSFMLECDRTEYVYVVSGLGPVRWLESPWRTEEAARVLEQPGTKPDVWWVSARSVGGRLFRKQKLT